MSLSIKKCASKHQKKPKNKFFYILDLPDLPAGDQKIMECFPEGFLGPNGSKGLLCVVIQ